MSAEERSPASSEAAAGLNMLELIPDLYSKFFEFFRPGHNEGVVPAPIKELFARHASATRQGLDEETISQIHLAVDDRKLEPRQALAVRLAEAMATDFRSVDAAFMAELRTQFSDAQVAELLMMIGQYISLGRILVITGAQHAACEIYVPEL